MRLLVYTDNKNSICTVASRRTAVSHRSKSPVINHLHNRREIATYIFKIKLSAGWWAYSLCLPNCRGKHGFAQPLGRTKPQTKPRTDPRTVGAVRVVYVRDSEARRCESTTRRISAHRFIVHTARVKPAAQLPPSPADRVLHHCHVNCTWKQQNNFDFKLLLNAIDRSLYISYTYFWLTKLRSNEWLHRN